MRVEELKRSRDSPRNRYLQESIHVEDSFLLDHEQINHQKNHQKLQNDFHNSKRLSHECQPTNLSWSADNNKATNGISLFCFWNQASNDKERAAGSLVRQAGRRRSESTTPHPPAQSSSNPHQSSVLANNTHHHIIHQKYSVLTTHHHIIHPYYGACACLQHPLSCHPLAIIRHVCFNNTHHHHHIIHPQIWWGLTNNPTIISFIHNVVCAAHSHHHIIHPQYGVR